MRKPFKLRYRDPEPCEARGVHLVTVLAPALRMIYCKRCGRLTNRYGLIHLKLEARR